MRYLGVPLHNRALLKKDGGFIVDKIEKKLQSWKGQLISIGGRLTLINSVISSVLLYALSMYKIPLGTVAQIDRIRIKLLWQGNTDKHKIPLVNWNLVCMHKE